MTAGIVTRVPDLSRVRLSELLARTPDPAEAEQLLKRIGQPGRSISGYNPQRVD